MVDQAKWLQIATRPVLTNSPGILSTSNLPKPQAQFTGFSISDQALQNVDQFTDSGEIEDSINIIATPKIINPKNYKTKSQNENLNQRSQIPRNYSRIERLESTLLKMNAVIEEQKEIIEKQRLALENLHHKLVSCNTDNFQRIYCKDLKENDAPKIQFQGQSQFEGKDVVTNQSAPLVSKNVLKEGQISETKGETGLVAKQVTAGKLKNVNDGYKISRGATRFELVQITSRLECIEEKLSKFESDLPKKIQGIIAKSQNQQQNSNSNTISCKCECRSDFPLGSITKPLNCTNYRSSLLIAENKLSDIEKAVDNFKECLLRCIAFKRV